MTKTILLRTCFILAVLTFYSHAAFSSEAPAASSNPALEKRVMAISEELRCLVCQNQTIADSHAELAVDLRNQVRELLIKGLSDREIKDYMVARYGDFVLYRPPLKENTWLLWIGPFVLLISAFIFAAIKLRQRGRLVAQSDLSLSPEAQHRAEKLLGITARGAENSTTSPKDNS